MIKQISKPIFVVTVTYGKRSHLLLKALESVFNEGVDCAIVVDNGSTEQILLLITERFGDKVILISLDRNTGSANGYKVGLQAAFNASAEYILLLDDDNILEQGALKVLKNGWMSLDTELPISDRIVLGFRLNILADIVDGVSKTHSSQSSNSFFGFHVKDIPFKLLRRTSWYRKSVAVKSLPLQISMKYAPYSGMFFHRELLEKHGYPDDRLVLYADDYEFSYRVTRAGGSIRLMTDARMEDIESSWNSSSLSD